MEILDGVVIISDTRDDLTFTLTVLRAQVRVYQGQNSLNWASANQQWTAELQENKTKTSFKQIRWTR